MNMTVVIVTRPMEFVLLLLALTFCVSTPLARLASGASPNVVESSQLKADLDDNRLGSLVRELGGQLEGDMEEEMERLVREVEAKRAEKRQSSRRLEVSQRELELLVHANKMAGQDIRARVEMAGDNAGALPQWSLGNRASSFLSATSQRLTAASSYVGNKLRSIGSRLSSRMPRKLKRFFEWPSFLTFKVRNHKVYKSAREELYRQMVFLRTHVKVGMQHLRFLLHRDRHLLGANQYADMTQDEIYEALNNEDLEAERRELQPESAAEHERRMGQLRQLAASKINIFGKEVETKKTRGHQLRKRSLGKNDVNNNNNNNDDNDDDDYNDNELDADEEDFPNIGLDFGDGEHETSNEAYDETALNDEESLRLVDEFANADLSDLDELDSNLDDALNGATNSNQQHNGGAPQFEPIDLRSTGCIIRAENQNNCGNCYSQAVTAAASYYNCMGNNNNSRQQLERYNPYFPSTCGQYMAAEGKPKWINGCQGGRISETIKFVKLIGLPHFMNYNVARVSARVIDTDECAYPRPPGPIEEHKWPVKLEPIEYFQRSRYTMLKFEEVDLHLRTVGPVFVNIRTWDNFEHYEAGIYDGKEDAQKPQLHSMLIVGHDRDQISGLDYYIILNSGGINWGEHGFLRVSAESLEYFQLMLVGLPPNSTAE